MSAKILGIDIGSIKVCAAMAELNASGEIAIIAISCTESKGLKKGAITNIELAASSISAAVNDVLRIAGTNYDKVVVSISGKDIKSLDAKSVINIPDKEVNLNQIERLMQDLCYRAKLDYEYEAIHVLPYNFKLDEQDNIEDPLGMSGSRLEVEAQIITANRASVVNLRKAIEKAGLKADNIVLCGYASSIATLNDDERQLGAVLIDMGGATCNLVVHSGNSLRYNDFLGVGSASITTDLSSVLHTPISKAEEVKLKVGALKREGNTIISLPDIGDETQSRDISIDTIIQVIFARVDETLRLLAEMLSRSEYAHLINAGVILTGGMTKLESIREVASSVFDRMPVRIARPNDLEGLNDKYKDPAYSCAIGLCLYGAGHFTPYEIDSERKMRYKGEESLEPQTNKLMMIEDFEEEKEIISEAKDDLNIKIESNSGVDLPRKPKLTANPISKFMNMVKNLF